MKLAAALQERADINSKIEELRGRLNRNVLVQEGELPSEQPGDLKKELDSLIERLIYLVAAINKTNCNTKIGENTITELIAKKDAISLKLNVCRDIIYTAGDNTNRARSTEIKIKSVINVKDWQKEADEMAKKIRLIDNRLQETNWTVDLME